MKNTSVGTVTRSDALDALRGYAILTMVLSGTIVFGILPEWMYHAQTPPPSHVFNPDIPGITWVDLVFPFFLFAMGAAFPFSLGRKLEKGVSPWKLSLQNVGRGLKLAFFAIFIQHMYPWIISEPSDYRAWFTTLFAFMLMFPMFMRLPWKMPAWLRYAIQAAAYAVAVAMLLTVNYANDRKFQLDFSNIIILVLANMAIFGSIAYIFTYKNKWLRIGILPFIMAVLLGAAYPDTWNEWLAGYSPFPWLYQFRFLKYLFIVIPGTVAGEYMLAWINKHGASANEDRRGEKRTAMLILCLSLALILLNLYSLFTRHLVANLLVSSVILLVGYLLLRRQNTSFILLWKKLFLAGAYCLLLGLFFEAFEGGIKKDNSTYSYYLVTSGLAFMAMIIFSVVCDYFKCRKSTSFLAMSGQNPMIAYVGSSMVIQPLLNITHIMPLMASWNESPWLGFFKGLLITALVTLMAMFFTKIKWFWRT